ncbi:two-component system response regulator CssR [Anaeroplasma bactoclasticum]|uniref:Two-component system response regulator CssR n=2 Tax=Anaeroplasma bactoclasticum TaxID=2088 RepID=A0A397S059_9MOLU|nr:two-component system response regulator CssR [Anaeroplasma bactoclasticum]
MYKIGLVEDEKNLSSLVEKYLINEGYEVEVFNNGEDASAHIKDNFSLWILDIMLPGVISGYDLIKSIRQENPTMPIIFTSARDQDIDKVMGLELGSDDYVAKPYSVRELMLRVKNLLNRSYGMVSPKKSNTEEFNGYEIDYDKRIVMENGVNINLTSKEYDLLLFLLKNKSKAFSRDQILDNVWGMDYFGSDRVVDDLMRRLRQKMPNLSVETIYGFGYRLLVWWRSFQFQPSY